MGHPHTSPLVVLVSNNAYALDHPLVRGSRPRLDTGVLGISWWIGRCRGSSSTAWSASSLDIRGTASLPAGLDGEALTLPPPLRWPSPRCAARTNLRTTHPGVSPSALLSTNCMPWRRQATLAAQTLSARPGGAGPGSARSWSCAPARAELEAERFGDQAGARDYSGRRRSVGSRERRSVVSHVRIASDDLAGAPTASPV